MQYAALKAFGGHTPATRVAVGRAAVLEAAKAMGAPVILKPNRGGTGLGVQLFNDLAALEAHVESDLFDDGPDGTVLVQQYVKPPDGAIIRHDFARGKFLYGVRCAPPNGFAISPDATRAVGAPVPPP